MFVETVIIALFAFPTISGGAVTDNVWTGFKATWARPNEKGFYDLPRSLEAATSQGWTEIKGVTNLKDVIAFGYQGNARYVIMYSLATRNAIGIQIGFPIADIASAKLATNYNKHPGIKRKKLNGVKYYTSSIFFAISDKGIREIRFDSPSSSNIIPTTTDGLLKKNKFLKKNCVQTMGTHWYQLTSATKCTDFFPWGLLSDGNNVIGFAFQVAGTTSVAPSRKWNEYFTVAGVLVAISDAPQCLLSDMGTNGIFSIHTWLIADPTRLTCS